MKEFSNIQPYNYKIYAVKEVNDNITSRHYKIFDK